MADMPIWLVIVLAAIFLAPILMGLAVIIWAAFFETSGPHPQNADGETHDRARCGLGGDCSSCGGD